MQASNLNSTKIPNAELLMNPEYIKYEALHITYLGLNTHSHQKVIKIHDGMYSKVNSTEDQSSWRLIDPCVPTAVKNGNMMVPVQENQWFLVDNDEKSIEQLGEFAQQEDKTPVGNSSRSEQRVG